MATKRRSVGPARAAYRVVAGDLSVLAHLPAHVDVAVVPRSKAAEAALTAAMPSGELKPFGVMFDVDCVESDAFSPGAKASALMRGREIAEEDLRSSGGAFDLGQVVDLLRISRQAVDKRVRDDALLAVPGPNGQRRYPVAQFGQDGVPVGLRDVLKAFPSSSPWVRLNYLVNPDSSLGDRRPMDLLHEGRTSAVVEAVKRIGEQGAGRLGRGLGLRVT